MMKNELLNLLKKEYGEGYEELLENLMIKNEIQSLESENKANLRMFARELRDSIPSLSLAKRNLVFSAIIRIFRLDVTEIGSDKLVFEKEDKKFTEEKKIETFIKNIKKTLSKYETIFNLFWLRAGEAELEGISHEDVLKTTQKALIGNKKDLEASKNELLHEFNILEKTIRHQKKNFHFKTGSIIETKIYEKNEKEFNDKKNTKEIFDQFWNDIEKQYNQFKIIFLESMEKDIKLKKQGLDDSELIEETKEKMITLWDNLEMSYKKFEEKMKNIKNEEKK